MSVLLTDELLRSCMELKSAAYESTAEAMGISSRSVRRWHKDFYTNKGQFSDYKRGKHLRLVLLREEDIKEKMTVWLREKVADRNYNLTARKFQQWLNTYLSSLELPEGYPRSVSERTALQYMRRLGFTHAPYKQGIYVDGHERADVVAYRKKFLAKIKALESKT